jgi:hypothetical protein
MTLAFLKKGIRRLYEGATPNGVRFRYALLAFAQCERRRWRLRNALPIEKASGGTGVRTDQTGARLPPVLLLRGVKKVRAEWAMICTAHNLLKLCTLANAA